MLWGDFSKDEIQTFDFLHEEMDQHKQYVWLKQVQKVLLWIEQKYGPSSMTFVRTINLLPGIRLLKLYQYLHQVQAHVSVHSRQALVYGFPDGDFTKLCVSVKERKRLKS